MVKIKTKKPCETIWKKNKIAPLEYCSLERAARLLGCEVEDILHWQETNKIRIAERITGEFTGFYRFDLPLAPNVTTEKVNQHVYKRMLSIGIEAVITESEISRDRQSLILVCEINGVLDILERIQHSKKDYIASYFMSVPQEDSRKRPHALLLASPSGNRREVSDNFLITRMNIEAIHNAMHNGYFDHNIEVPTSDEDMPRPTVHQFTVMFALLRLAGLSEDEIRNISPSELNKKLREAGEGKGINIPQPDKKTWASWREKFH
ncbi:MULTISPECIES: hypothetical protein [unclassified Serratia (in: enterobacteria)]|uniref:hypothetical protein n=1 Tax=unclassified Serratia (in: enterobacteria) TaxID=2647522 RepID=UPI0030766A73